MKPTRWVNPFANNDQTPLPPILDYLLTIAVWLPFAMPLISVLLGQAPYLIESPSPLAWLLILGGVVAIVEIISPFIPSPIYWKHILVFGLAIPAGLSALPFLIIGIVSIPFNSGREIWMIFVLLLPISLISFISAFFRYAYGKDSSQYISFRVWVEFYALVVAVGSILGFPVGYIVHALNASVGISVIVALMVTIFAGVVCYFAVDALVQSIGQIPRWVYALYALSWIVLIWMYPLGGWKILFPVA